MHSLSAHAQILLSHFFFHDTATTEIYTYLTHSFPTRRSSDLLSPDCGRGSDQGHLQAIQLPDRAGSQIRSRYPRLRSEEHTSELQSLMRIPYDVFCLKKNNKIDHHRLINNSSYIC